MKTFFLFLLAGVVSAETMSVKIIPGDHWHHSFKMSFLTINTTPQFAIWLEDSCGRFLTTLSVTQASAKSSFKGAKKTSRPSSLPVWAHARGVKGEHGNFMPSRNKPVADAVTSASQKNESTVECLLPDSLSGRTMRLKVEINNSMDFNDYYSKDIPESNPGYNADVNGQPSLIYETDIFPQMIFPDTLKLTGHGHPAGNDGTINNDLSQITTASHIVKTITITAIH